MKKLNIKKRSLKMSVTALLIGLIAVSGIESVFAGACYFVAKSNLHIPHDGNVYSAKRTFNQATQSLNYQWDYIESGITGRPELIVKLCTKDFWGNYNPKKTVTLYTTESSKEDSVRFVNVGSGKYAFHHTTQAGKQASYGKFDSDNVIIYTES